MMYQAVFRKYGESVHVPVEADSQEQAVGCAYRDNPMLASWSLTVKLLTENEQAKDDRAELKFVEPRQPGRPVEREGTYRKISLEMATDVLAFIDSQLISRREYIERLVRREMEQESDE